MRKFMIRHTAFTTLMLSAFFSFGQKRSINMDILFNTPYPADTLRSGIRTPIIGSVLNNGPDDLVAGDTLVFVTKINTTTVLDVKVMTLPKGIAKGEQLEIFKDSIMLEAAPGSISGTYVCLEVLSDPSTQAEINGALREISYRDPEPELNEACNGVYIDGRSTALTTIDKPAVQFNIFPNPASSKISLISYLYHGEKETHITIRNILGKTVQSLGYVSTTHREGEQLEIDISSLSNGLYFIELHNGAQKTSSKLVVRH